MATPLPRPTPNLTFSIVPFAVWPIRYPLSPFFKFIKLGIYWHLFLLFFFFFVKTVLDWGHVSKIYVMCSCDQGEGRLPFPVLWGGWRVEIFCPHLLNESPLSSVTAASDFPLCAEWQEKGRQRESPSRASTGPFFLVASVCPLEDTGTTFSMPTSWGSPWLLCSPGRARCFWNLVGEGELGL